MDVRKRFRFPWITVAVVAVAAVGVAYGATFVFAKPEEKLQKPVAEASDAPVIPPKVEFLGAVVANGRPMLPPTGKGNPAESYSDDAMVLWFKLTSEKPLTRANTPRMMITDDQGTLYSATPERRDDGLVALHLQRGYARPLKSLFVNAGVADNALGRWEIKNVPPPVVEFPDSAVMGKNPPGEVVLHPGRARPVAQLEMNKIDDKDAGCILMPIAESHAKLDPKRFPQRIMSIPGDPPLKVRMQIPNAEMNRGVQFDVVDYRGDVQTFTATFHNVSLVDRFGQPTFVVASPETVKTPSGDVVTIDAQDAGPKHAPPATHPRAGLEVNFQPAGATDQAVAFISSTAIAEIQSPTAASLGLESSPVSLSVIEKRSDAKIFHLPYPPSTGAAGQFKFGPIPELTLKITVIRPRVTSKRRVILPIVNSSEPLAGPGGGPGMAAPAARSQR